MSSIAILLGTGLIKKEKRVKEDLKQEGKIKFLRRSRRDASVENFLRKVLGNGLLQIEKKF